jgi:hypothetical protein
LSLFLGGLLPVSPLHCKGLSSCETWSLRAQRANPNNQSSIPVLSEIEGILNHLYGLSCLP